MTNTNDQEEDHQQSCTSSIQVRIALTLSSDVRDRSLEVSSDPIAVPSSLTHKDLSTVINHLLGRGSDDDEDKSDDDEATRKDIPFDFVLQSFHVESSTSTQQRLLRGGIESQARQLGYSLEEAIPITYFPSRQYRPSPNQNAKSVPDWLSCLHVVNFPTSENSKSSSMVLSGCYDVSLRVYCSFEASPDNGENRPPTSSCTIAAAHSGPIKCVSGTSVSSRSRGNNNLDVLVATGSLDHTIKLFRVETSTSSSSPLATTSTLLAHCGSDLVAGSHTSSVEAIDLVHPHWLASGDYDGTLCVWNVSDDALQQYAMEGNNMDDDGNANHSHKKKKTSSTSSSSTHNGTAPPATLHPKITIRAHNSSISGLSWGNHHRLHHNYASSSSSSESAFDRLITGSWDHSIRLWDVERQDVLLTLNGSKVISCLDTSYYSPGIVATGHPDCTIRCWDVRVPHEINALEGKDNSTPASSLVADTTLKPSHKGWITNVKWDPTSPYHLVSSSRDGSVKVWDLRSSLPLQTVKVVQAKGETALCVAFANNGSTILAGGSEGTLQSFQRIH